MIVGKMKKALSFGRTLMYENKRVPTPHVGMPLILRYWASRLLATRPWMASGSRTTLRGFRRLRTIGNGR